MKTNPERLELATGTSFILCLIIAFVIVFPSTMFSGQAAQKTFPAPEDAVAALVKALKDSNMKELNAVFGPNSKRILYSGDPVADKASRERFVTAFEEKNSLAREGDSKAILYLGKDDYPFPVPIVQKKGRWFFDAMAGRDEILNRAIGRNELNTIETCLAYVDAQREYAQKGYGVGGVGEYAQKFVSTPGKRDGLYWDAKEGEDESPLGDLFARATSEGYQKKDAKPVPYHGYYFRILRSQGRSAPDGAFDYILNGRMIGGFAMVAYPAQYGTSGIMSFIVNHDGVVYQKDFGPNTVKIARTLKVYDPDRSWKRTR